MTKSSAKKSEKPVEELTYEEALAELENIVDTLENEERPLDDALKFFERGQALAVRCDTLLESARLKVQKLSGESVAAFEEDAE